MLPQLLPLLLSLQPHAPALGRYLFEPSDMRIPEWTDPLVDSLRSDRPTGFQAEVRDTTGRVIGRDTLELRLLGGTIHSRKVQWKYGADTTRSIRERWRRGIDGPVDSLRDLSCTRDSCSSEITQWAVTLPDGQLGVLAYPPSSGSSTPRHDSILVRTDAKGRLTYQRVWHSTSAQYEIDSVAWNGDEPTRWRCDRQNAGTLTTEIHTPAWDGIRLVRDSVALRIAPYGGTATDSAFVRVCSWDGPRFLRCLSLPDSSTLSAMEWNAPGQPSFLFDGAHFAAWGWDTQGRLTRERQWGTETDLDSLVYGTGILPERSHVFDCSGDTPLDADVCSLRKIRLYSYSPISANRVVHTARTPANLRIAGGVLRFAALASDIAQIALATPDGRILTATSPTAGSCTLVLPRARGILVWTFLDARGRALKTGTIPAL